MIEVPSTIANRQSTIIKVLVVDDSPTAREFIAHAITGPDIRVIGTASDGNEAVEFVKRTRPDVITMDIYMPGMGGLEATRRIMETNPVPIIIVSGNWDPREVETTFRAMEAGALAIVHRPQGIGHPGHKAAVKELIETLRLMSEVKVVRRWPSVRTTVAEAPAPPRSLPHGEIELVAIGASTGGPPVLQTILSGLPRDFPAPVLIVQHMATGFLQGMVDWLGETCPMPLKIAAFGENVLPGHVYFAPDGHHMGIESRNKIVLTAEAPEHGARPSVSYLFRSVAKSYGGTAAGVLLTGMGRDGAEEMKALKEKGAATIAQDRESSVVYGMPAAAVELGAADYVLSPQQIPAALRDLTKKRAFRTGTP
jgi:two-component system chemotaxis response regulator CheB